MISSTTKKATYLTSISAFLAAAYAWWYYTSSKGCSLNEQKRLRSKLLNLFLLSMIGFVVLYSVWLYVVVDLFGIVLNIW